MRILIVEDDKVSSELLVRTFSGYGSCDVTVDGVEAVDAFILALEEGKPYDLICLDLMLPILDGENVLSIIRKVEKEKKIESLKKTRVIIISALNDPELTSQLTAYGFDRYFIKPVNFEQIRNFINSL